MMAVIRATAALRAAAWTRACRLAAACLLGLLVLVQPAHADYSDRELTEGFLRTVFGLEYRAWSWQPYLVKKFVAPVRFHVVNLARRDRSAEVRRFIRRLPRAIAGLDAAMARSPREANFEVYVVDRAQYAEVVRSKIYGSATARAPGRCLVRVTSGRRGIERSAAVIVADEGDHLFRRCIVEELLQGLGPMNDDESLVHSVFNDLSQHDTFTRFDRLLLNMLYDRRIRPGMNAGKVKPLLPAVIRDARRRVR